MLSRLQHPALINSVITAVYYNNNNNKKIKTMMKYASESQTFSCPPWLEGLFHGEKGTLQHFASAINALLLGIKLY